MTAKVLGIYATVGLLSIIVAGCAAPKNESSVTGTLTYLERIALPETAEISVQIQDVSRADAPAIIIGEEQFPSDGKQVPFPFSVKYDTGEIVENHSYVVRGEIRVDGTLLFTTTQAYPVITRGNPTSGIELILTKVK